MSSMELSKYEAEAETDRIKAESEQLCPACEHVLWLSFYFDGFGFSEREGSETNILKLYRAAYERPDKGMRAFYYPGLGAHFDPETAALAAALGEKALEQTGDKAKSEAEGKAKKAVTETVSDAWKRSKGNRDKSLLGRAIWTAGEVWDETVEGAGDAARSVRRALAKPRKQWQRIKRSLRREWQAYWGEVMRHPWKATKASAATATKLSAGYVAESIGLVRDNELISALFNTGVDTRLEAAELDFKRAVKTAQRQSKINKIHVAIFGYDMGGGLSLAFSNSLLTELCSGGRYDGVPVHIKFMGLFDCVTNRYEDNFLTGFAPLSNEVSSDLKLLPKVERCVHYAAAHELRFYKPLTIIGADPADVRGSRQERLFPGAQADVGGGVEDGEDGVSDKLARLPLQMMYNRGYAAGVPMPSLAKMEQENPDLYEKFAIPDDVDRFQLDYRSVVKKLVSQTREIPPLTIRMGLPVECTYTTSETRTAAQQTMCTVPDKAITVTTMPKDIVGELKGHAVVYIQWLRIWFDHNQAAAGKMTRGWGLGVPVDPQAHGRYEKVTDELEYLERNARAGSHFTQEQAMKQLGGEVPPNMFLTDPQGQALYWLWNNPGAHNAEIDRLYPPFAKHVHDSMAECPIETAFNDLVYAKHYFNSRPMQKISTEPDKTFLEKVQVIYEKLVS